MKRLILFVSIYFSIYFKGIAQEIETIPSSIDEVTQIINSDSVIFYYNETWSLVRPECAFIFRVSGVDTITWNFNKKFIDYYMDSTKALEGSYNNGLKDGFFKLYHPNGQLLTTGSYLNGNKIGVWDYWYEDGKKKQQIVFDEYGAKIMEFWNEKGDKKIDNGNGNWSGYESDAKLILVKGKVVNGLKEGKWQRILSDRDFVMNVEEYKNGKLISGKQIPLFAGASQEKYNDTTFCNYSFKDDFENAELFRIASCNQRKKREFATYPGGERGLGNEINVKFEMPKEARGVKGDIIVSATISKEGILTNPIAVSALGYGLEEELIRVLRTLSKWTPMKTNGVTESFKKTFTLTIK